MYVLVCSMPALGGSAAPILRKGTRLSAREQHGTRIFLSRTAHGHFRQLQIFRERTPAHDCSG